MGEADPWRRRRRQQTSDEMAELMLDAGARRVERDGLRVNFDLVALEEIIVEAGVSRAAVYRRWSTKDAYLAELLLEVARRQLVVTFGPTDAAAAFAAIDTEAVLAGAEGRRAALLGIMQHGVRATLEHLRTSQPFTMRLQLVASLMGLPESDYRATLAQVLAETEQRIVESLGEGSRAVGQALGWRTREGLDFDDLAAAGAALLTGAVISEAVTRTESRVLTGVDLFGLGSRGDWSVQEVAFTSIFMQALEMLPHDEYLASSGPELLRQLAGAAQG